MKEIHVLKDVDIDLSDAVLRHSADESIVYKVVDGEPIYLGYFFPKDYDHTLRYPTFVFIHGGGWEGHQVFADQKHWQGDHLGFLARYYAERGFVCVSVDYRLIKECGQREGYGLIESYEDCCDAMDYVISHANEYGVDVNRMYLLGESAGGHLAGAVATFHYDRRYSFRKVFLMNPITDLSDEVWGRRVPAKSNHEVLRSLSVEERARFLSPLSQVDGDMSDVVLMHGASDRIVSPSHSERFYHRMCELENSCDLHMIEETGHAFLLAEYMSDLTACKMGIEIINEYVCQ